VRAVRRRLRECFWLRSQDFYEKAGCVKGFSLLVPLRPDLRSNWPATTAVQAEQSEFIAEPGRRRQPAVFRIFRAKGTNVLRVLFNRDLIYSADSADSPCFYSHYVWSMSSVPVGVLDS
jgi:hypothetical protein